MVTEGSKSPYFRCRGCTHCVRTDSRTPPTVGDWGVVVGGEREVDAGWCPGNVRDPDGFRGRDVVSRVNWEREGSLGSSVEGTRGL